MLTQNFSNHSKFQDTLPWKNETLRHLQYLHPNLKTSPKAIPSVTSSRKTYNVLSNTDDIKISHAKLTEQIELEFRVYQTTPNLPKMDSSLDIYWHSVGKMEDLQGKLMFENLSRFAKTCHCTVCRECTA